MAPSSIGISPTPACPGILRRSTASPPCTSKNPCCRTSASASAGELVGITRATGAGEELPAAPGRRFLTNDFEGIRRNGRVAHLGHKPWLMNDSIRNKFCSANPGTDRYQWVLGACARTTDLGLLSHGDRTLVGELGTRLSGGQQRQVALARPSMQEPTSLLLDSLSALDPIVSAQVLERGSPSNRDRPGCW